MKNKSLTFVFLLYILCCNGQNASFVYSQPDKCVVSTVVFTNTSPAGYTDITWNWGDPNDPNPEYKGPENPTSHPFGQPGMYVVTLTLTYPSGTVSYKDTIWVYAKPIFSFQKLNDSICPNGSISFSSSLVYPATSAGVKSYFWNFGDGRSDTTSNPTHVYANSANISTHYNVSLTVTDTNGCQTPVDSISYVYVKNKPIARFDADSILCFISGATSATVNFTNQTTGAVSYFWDFGDGNSSTQTNPSHTFAYNPAPYIVTLIATNAENCTDTFKKIVQPLAHKVEFTVSDTTLCNVPDSKVTFRGTSLESAYRWYLGDGNNIFSTVVEHVYETQGNYLVRVESTHSTGCRAVDSIIIHAYARLNPVHDERYKIWERLDVLNRTVCDPSIPITFINTTSYELFDDFGLGSITWIFEEDTIVTKGDTVTYQFSDYGRHYYTAIITTPYGCVLDTVWRDSVLMDLGWEIDPAAASPYWWEPDFIAGCEDTFWASWMLREFIFGYDTLYRSPLLSHYVEIFRTRTSSIGSGLGCIPAAGSFMGGGSTFPAILSASPVIEAVIYWDFFGDATDTTHVALPFPPMPMICGIYETHIYPDTGCFQIALVVTNTDGCVDTFLRGTACAGIPPAGTFSYEYKEQCYDDYFNDGSRFYAKFEDSLHTSTAWLIIDNEFRDSSVTMDNPMIISPKDTGYWSVEIVPIHYGCLGTGRKIDSVFYTCPPRAYFDFENVDSSNMFIWWDEGESPKFCKMPATMGFQDMSSGSQGRQWWFGDGEFLADQSTDTAERTSFTYLSTDSVVYARSGAMLLTATLAAYNADSIDIYSPTYNRCGYCADTTKRIILISHATMNFVADNYEKACTHDSITFYDSTIVNVEYFWFWTFWIDSAANTDPEFLDFPIGEPFIPFPPPLTVNYYYPGTIMWGSFGQKTLLFTKPNVYRLVMYDSCILECPRYDTLSITIYPQSVPQYVSSSDNSHFSFSGDTLCLNKPDTLYLKDSSYTAFPFEDVTITQWQWVVFGDTIREQNPFFVPETRGLHPVELTISNEKGCDSSLLVSNYILVSEIDPLFTTPQKRYCNGSEVVFINRSLFVPLFESQNINMTCIWDWGDGSLQEVQYLTNGEQDTMLHTYNLPKATDTIVVTLTVMPDRMNCVDVYRDTLYIGSLQADFTDDGHYFPCTGNLGRTINFTDSSKGNPTYYIWNFGDIASGSSNEVQGPDDSSPIHNYSKPGNYDVTLIVFDDIGCVDTLVKKAYVFIDGPVGNFSYSPLSGCVDLEVVFVPEVENTDTIIVNPNSSIEIRQGGNYVDSNISYTYEKIGAYLPYFYIVKWTDNNGILEQCILEWPGKDTIFVIDIQPDFNTDSLYCMNNPITFQNESSLMPDTYLLDSIHWDFGNGDYSTLSTATTKYDSSGIYNVTLTIYAKNCSKSITHPIHIMPFPELHFYPDSASSCNDLEVVFTTDTLTDWENSCIVRYDWTFSDGEKYTGNPVRRTFAQTGQYTYNVLVTFTPENCTNQYDDSIYVDVFIAPTAEFEPTPSTVRMGESIRFLDKSQPGDGDIISWHWSLGEDTDSQDQNPTHTYQYTSGYITVYLVVKDTNGCKDSTAHQVLILENLRFPNIFTPQSIRPDGKLCVFRPLEEDGFFKEFKVDIYNRYGMLIWSQSCKEPNCPDYQNDSFWWDGKTQMGLPVSDGVYYWVVYAVPLSETTTFILNGSVTVVRGEK